MMKRLISLSMLCLLIGGYNALSQPIGLEVYSNDPEGDNAQGAWDADADLAEAMEGRLIELIDGAQESVDCALYEMGRMNVVQALIDAHDRGVTVQLTTDWQNYDDPENDEEAIEALEALQEAGIPVEIEGGAAYSHNKFIVIDGEHVWTGSTNITDNGFTYNANNAVLVRSEAVADTYTEEFDVMFGEADDPADGRFHNSKDDLGVRWFDLAEGGRLEEGEVDEGDLEGLMAVVFSPEGHHTKGEFLREIADADSSLYFCIFSFTDDDIAQAMIDASNQRGVEVRGVFNAGSNPRLSDLCDALGNMKRDDYSGLLHHKFIVIDAGTDSDPTVITGSYNWSGQAENSNDENTVIVHDRDVADAYYRIFENIYTNRSSDTNCPGAEGLAPRYFIEGSVMDGNGEGMPGIVVALSGDQEWSRVTDEEGGYRFATLREGVYTVTVEDQEGVSFTLSPDGAPGDNARTYDPLEAGETDQRFYLVTEQPETYSISGTVYGPDGETGLQGIRVLLDSKMSGSAETETDESGSYVFEGLETDTFGVVVKDQEGYSFDTSPSASEGHAYEYSPLVESQEGQDFYAFDMSLPDLRVTDVSIRPHAWPHYRSLYVTVQNRHRHVEPVPEGCRYFYIGIEAVRRNGEGELESCRNGKPGWEKAKAVTGRYYNSLVERGSMRIYASDTTYPDMVGYLVGIDVDPDGSLAPCPGYVAEACEGNNILFVEYTP